MSTDWDAAEARLATRTDDEVVLEAFARLRESGALDSAFMEWVISADASLNWIFFDRGCCMMSNARYLGRVVAVESGGVDSMVRTVAPVPKRGRSKEP